MLTPLQQRLAPRDFGLDQDGFERLAAFVRDLRHQLLDETFRRL